MIIFIHVGGGLGGRDRLYDDGNGADDTPFIRSIRLRPSARIFPRKIETDDDDTLSFPFFEISA